MLSDDFIENCFFLFFYCNSNYYYTKINASKVVVQLVTLLVITLKSVNANLFKICILLFLILKMRI